MPSLPLHSHLAIDILPSNIPLSDSAASSRSLSSSRNGPNHTIRLRFPPASKHSLRRHTLAIIRTDAKLRKKAPPVDYPWPRKLLPGDLKGSPLSFLSRFKPLPSPPKPTPLPFEIPLMDILNKIQEVRGIAKRTGMDFSSQLSELQEKYDEVLKDLYSQLSPVQRLSVARHPNRPTCLDHVLNIADKWLELHGDRAGYDDPAIVTGIGKIDGMGFMFVGHQKGRNTKENIRRNFAMPTPNGYRKALRMMQHADHHGFPILTFVDTPGAYAGIQAEKQGQGEAIARNLREMFGLKVPIITTVIGEGGSGGALGIGCCNKMLMLENSVYYVASPEACAAILWKNAACAPQAAEALKITANELVKLNVVDEVIPEPIGGAHSDPYTTSMSMKEVIVKYMRELLELDPETLVAQRAAKFRKMGRVEEEVKLNPRTKRNMKARDAPAEVVIDKPMFLLPSSHVRKNLELSLMSSASTSVALNRHHHHPD